MSFLLNLYAKLNIISFCDYSVRGQFGFQDASTSIMQGIINLHHHIFFFIIIVLIFVSYMMIRTYKVSVWNFNINNKYNFFSSYIAMVKASLLIHKNFVQKLKLYYNLNVSHGTTIEIIWTIIPSLILLCVVGPSFALLFAMDAIADPDYSVKVIGHQWYWSYEYTDSYFLNGFVSNVNSALNLNNDNFLQYINEQQFFEYTFDSYMKATPDLLKGELRLLETDLALYLPVYSKIRLDITSDDVMHAFAVPSLGIKIDAIPGRLNVVYVDILREGIFFGQCSELCGVNHGYMPIKVVAVDVADFINYLCCLQSYGINNNVLGSTKLTFSDICNFVINYGYEPFKFVDGEDIDNCSTDGCSII